LKKAIFAKGKPAFLMIGGEGPANPIWMVTGTWIEVKKSNQILL